MQHCQIDCARMLCICALGTSLLFHNAQAGLATAGLFAAGASDVATSTTPVYLPSGIAGIELNLALGDNSWSGTRVATMGWSPGKLSVTGRSIVTNHVVRRRARHDQLP
jgi:hypothetical protein